MRALLFALLLAVAAADLAPLFKMENNIPGEYLVVMKVRLFAIVCGGNLKNLGSGQRQKLE